MERKKANFRLKAEVEPKGDQPQAIKELVEGVLRGEKHQVLLGVTGSGKTFTMANVIAQVGRPTLVIAPNKTLAAQLYNEFKKLFPENAVEYFVSYYDYYQPEAYVPVTDTYIEKDASINELIDRLRHSATAAVLSRRDVIVVASVSCIYGLGSPHEYFQKHLYLRRGQTISRDELLRALVTMHYERTELEFTRATFRVRGDIIEIFPANEEKRAVRLSLWGNEVEEIKIIDPFRGKVLGKVDEVLIFPASHYVTSEDKLKVAIEEIKKELKERVEWFRSQGQYLYAERLEKRTLYDLELLEEIGYCKGIENYSRYLDGRKPGEPPYTLLDYFPDDFLIFIDESHITIPQLRGMYRGDRSRKETLVEYGFRLPSALDNRPLTFEEFEERVNQVIYVSATPGEYELEKAQGRVIEQIIRPTGLLDPKVEIRPSENQVEDLFFEIKKRVEKNERVLVCTLTKRMAEELTDYYQGLGIKACYMHSDLKTLERARIIRDLRRGVYDVLIGINLLREGLDLPEVSLIAILDADKEGFLRSERSLIQMIGRASRNVNGTAILYAQTITPAIEKAVKETERRRKIQEEYNKKHGIIPQTVVKSLDDPLMKIVEADFVDLEKVIEISESFESLEALKQEIARVEKEMKEAAKNYEFEKAAVLRDRLFTLKQMALQWE
ncbi:MULTISPECIES: excinuclease ABC subunit UvrB [Thermodesulfobacterium]|jgi:excinuclease ABC subunit B|uniref:UvrABC system protein B n=1 Tax=Thermodesulfobacterium commune TaxID=1741 RepID=A0A101FI28_9BACT|nr:excinuclease ABC subunit UvrB [Thermodesulfobacterium sp.]KUJ97845.1 MAG: UvrABC system protein B [Thermodesulfobacterium sp. 37_54]KUK19844.1 MAG: UvrABC system protein B [Thermodesulfobacterium commune]KUK37397.1 MAG: UvrABC system protein B [Thermodesulfobacterium commune]MBZ4682311.1 excinuclease subunit [Thermodesulfobacterium sp.]MDK2861347.1 excinuclease subunit [Thermodesulfobacterium sp.]